MISPKLSSAKSRIAMEAGAKDGRRLIDERASEGDDAEAYAAGVMLGAYAKILLTWGVDPALLKTLTRGD